MSVALAQAEIKRFLATNEPEVLCLKGKWGVGKTYTWTKFLKAAKGNIPHKRYSYVSLFGLNSMDQLRAAIVENAIPTKKIGEPLDLGSALSDLRDTADRAWRRALSYVNLVPMQRLKDLVAIVQATSFLAVYDQLICIDDLERKGNDLKIRDVLGLTSYLKEQRNCKVVLILNDGAFDQNENADFVRFFEKTVDSHVIFAPSAEECATIALPDNSVLHNAMRPHCVMLRISNIRAIRRIARLGAMLESKLSTYDPEVLGRAVKVITLLGWGRYDDDAPSLEFLKGWRVGYKAKQGEVSDEEKQWGPLLNEYGFIYFTELEQVLCAGVENGFFDDTKLTAQAAKLHADRNAQRLHDKFHNAWRLYHDSFKDNEEELVRALSTSFKEGVRQIDPGNANGTVSLLKELGRNELASELIKFYVDNNDDNVFDRDRLFSEDSLSDGEFAEAFDARAAKKTDDRKLSDIFVAIARNRGWDRCDVAKLSAASADDYSAIFKDLESEQLAGAVRAALQFGKIGGVGDQEKQIAQRVTEALQKIGRQNKLNRRRVVNKYGIAVDG